MKWMLIYDIIFSNDIVFPFDVSTEIIAMFFECVVLQFNKLTFGFDFPTFINNFQNNFKKFYRCLVFIIFFM